MSTKYKLLIPVVLFLGAVLAIALFLYGNEIVVLNPQGMIAEQQRDLMVVATLLILVVVVPVFVLTFTIAWKYREGNTKAKYTPEWDHDGRLEAIWWGIPLVIIVALSGIIWTSTHQLDPYRPLDSDKKPLKIQVIALQWKWLFIYPEQNIATVNRVYFPEDTPVNFQITSDAPMNSFWIPSLGGQVYAMAGMSTELHLIANMTGTFEGSSANLSGEGFSKMRFTAESTSEAEFEEWVDLMKLAPWELNMDRYNQLANPEIKNAPYIYSTTDPLLYDKVIEKYTLPAGQTHRGLHGAAHEGME